MATSSIDSPTPISVGPNEMQMDFSKLCRICLLDNATVNITDQTASVCTTEEGIETETQDYTILELILEMYDKHICLDLIPEAPMICIECLDNCLQNYKFFIKLKIANLQLRELYKAKDLHLEVVTEEESIDDFNEIIVMEIPNDEQNNSKESPSQETPESISNQDSLIVSDFLPVRQVQKDSGYTYPAVHTLDYAAVELNRDNLQEYIEANRQQDSFPEYSGTSVYKCRYCPMAYASSEFLKTHMRKTHVCQYCTMSFVKVTDLNEHIRNNHSHHSCVVCKKVFVSNTNLRAHIKHLHGIQLPAQVALLDYRPGNSNESLE